MMILKPTEAIILSMWETQPNLDGCLPDELTKDPFFGLNISELGEKLNKANVLGTKSHPCLWIYWSLVTAEQAEQGCERLS